MPTYNENNAFPSAPVYMLSTDEQAESASLTAYEVGVSQMATTAGANWGPNSAQAGVVETVNYGDANGIQRFHEYANVLHVRAFTSSAWSAWKTVTTE